LNESNNYTDIQILKLCDSRIKNIKLLKYHFSDNHAVFFFLYTHKIKLSGVCFYKLISQQELLNFIKENKFLLNEGCTIFIPQTLKKVDSVPFSDNNLY
jgi:hypothetical protein